MPAATPTVIVIALSLSLLAEVALVVVRLLALDLVGADLSLADAVASIAVGLALMATTFILAHVKVRFLGELKFAEASGIVVSLTTLRHSLWALPPGSTSTGLAILVVVS